MLCKLVRDIQQAQLGTDHEGLYSGWLMTALMSLLSPRFPPAALALVQLAEAEDVTEAGKKSKKKKKGKQVENKRKESRQKIIDKECSPIIKERTMIRSTQAVAFC